MLMGRLLLGVRRTHPRLVIGALLELRNESEGGVGVRVLELFEEDHSLPTMHTPVSKSQPPAQSSFATTHIPSTQLDVLLPEHWCVLGAHSRHLVSTQRAEAQSEDA